MVQKLLPGSTAVNSRDNDDKTPLHLASNCPNLVQLLPKHGADVISRDWNQTTALHHESLLQDLDVARVLLSRGANVSRQTGPGAIASGD